MKYFQDAASAPARELAPITYSEEGYTEKGTRGYQKQEVRRICAELPTVEGFARSIEVSVMTLHRWCDRYESFRDAYARAKDIQKQLLIDRGLTRQYDPTAFIFVAQNITDMRARIETKNEHTGANGGPLTIQVIDDIIGDDSEE